MELRYFVIDETLQLRRAPHDVVEDVWRRRRSADQFHCVIGEELRLITVVVDENLLPRMSYFLRLDLEDGKPTEQSRCEAFEAMQHSSGRRYDHPIARRQFEGWPRNWQQQLAVALDVPVSYLQRVGVGGPLPMSDAWGISLDKVLDYFELADDR